MINKKPSFDILYEDKEIIVVYKKSGLLSIATEKDETHNLYHYVREYANLHRQKIFIVHRLDKETSGVMIFAKSIETKERLQKAFEENQVTRLYECVVREDVELGKKFTVKQYLYRDKTSGRTFITDDPKKGKLAITTFEAKNKTEKGTAMLVTLSTGRQNQIRLALKSSKLTLIGDEKYSFDKEKRMYLNAFSLIFDDSIRMRKRDFVKDPLWINKSTLKKSA